MNAHVGPAQTLKFRAQSLLAYVLEPVQPLDEWFSALDGWLARRMGVVSVLGKFLDPELDLHPDTVPNEVMGHIFEELIRRFSEMSNETAGEHFTPREVVRLCAELVLAGDDGFCPSCGREIVPGQTHFCPSCQPTPRTRARKSKRRSKS